MSLTARQLRPDHPAKPHRLAADKQIGEEAGREFRRVAEELGDTVGPDDLLSVVSEKFPQAVLRKFPQQGTMPDKVDDVSRKFLQQDTMPDRSNVDRRSWRFRNRNLVAVAIYLTIFGVIYYLLS